MNAKILMKTARSAVLALEDGGIYNTIETYQIFLNGTCYKETDTVITSLFDLKPETAYEVEIKKADGTAVAKRFVSHGL